MPISHPPFYATYLAKRLGPYATLGLAEDTWALNEGVIDDDAFLKQTYDIDRERERMFFAALASSTCSGAISSPAIRQRAEPTRLPATRFAISTSTTTRCSAA